ncbi:MAG: metal-dependent transcriptional regulator [Chloroflexi bacterium]|jgi:DtxR family transcriptional regulator, Mn-dependent transcriptional regulator|nr:metal-dependent transcriptional regulator [Chloroflexota bacterium]
MISEAAQEVLEKLWIETVDGRETSTDKKSVGRENVIRGLLKSNHIVSKGNNVQLTKSGYEEARKVIRRHRLAERLFHDVLDVGEEDMEDTACKVEHILSEGVTRSICTLLGHPTECPHGKPIPPGKCCKEKKKSAISVVSSVADLKKGQKGKIVYVLTKKDKNLQKLMAMGVLPGQSVEVIQTSPSYVFQVGQTQVAVDKEIAGSIFVRSA